MCELLLKARSFTPQVPKTLTTNNLHKEGLDLESHRLRLGKWQVPSLVVLSMHPKSWVLQKVPWKMRGQPKWMGL